jgi:hypothetical protein
MPAVTFDLALTSREVKKKALTSRDNLPILGTFTATSLKFQLSRVSGFTGTIHA